jgi:hypothetical protein
LIKSYIGLTIPTATGSPNTILRIEDGSVIVGTKKSPAGESEPIEHVQWALQHLVTEGEFTLETKLGTRRTNRKSFLMAVLLSLPGVEQDEKSSKVVAVLTDREKLLHHLKSLPK